MDKKELHIGKRITIIREDNGLNYSQFAKQLSIDGLKFEHSNIRKYENGNVIPSTYFYYAIFIVFDVNLNWLIGGVGNRYLSSKIIEPTRTNKNKLNVFQV